MLVGALPCVSYLKVLATGSMVCTARVSQVLPVSHQSGSYADSSPD